MKSFTLDRTQNAAGHYITINVSENCVTNSIVMFQIHDPVFEYLN